MGREKETNCHRQSLSSPVSPFRLQRRVRVRARVLRRVWVTHRAALCLRTLPATAALQLCLLPPPPPLSRSRSERPRSPARRGKRPSDYSLNSAELYASSGCPAWSPRSPLLLLSRRTGVDATRGQRGRGFEKLLSPLRNFHLLRRSFSPVSSASARGEPLRGEGARARRGAERGSSIGEENSTFRFFSMPRWKKGGSPPVISIPPREEGRGMRRDHLVGISGSIEIGEEKRGASCLGMGGAHD